jgi:small subunit ribosomal protein S11
MTAEQTNKEEQAPAAAPDAAKAPKGRKKDKKVPRNGVVHIQSTFNNTIISITDPTGALVSWASAGTQGFKGSRKSTPFAAQRAAEQCAQKAKKLGMKEVDIRIKGPGSGRESAIRAIQASGLEIKAIEDVTPLPHNGCRARKRRRV